MIETLNKTLKKLHFTYQCKIIYIYLTMEKFLIDFKNKINCGLLKKTEVAKRIGISRPTLNSRLKKNNWKKSEKLLIKVLF